ncbi:hypothetical protein ACIQRJ_10105 [Streptomyces niveus]
MAVLVTPSLLGGVTLAPGPTPDGTPGSPGPSGEAGHAVVSGPAR